MMSSILLEDLNNSTFCNRNFSARDSGDEPAVTLAVTAAAVGSAVIPAPAVMCAASGCSSRALVRVGAARGAVAVGFYREIVGRGISFFQLTWFMLPVGCVMTIVLWLYCMVIFKPEKSTIPGLRERAIMLYKKLGPMSRTEILALVIIFSAITAMGARQFVPDYIAVHLHKSTVSPNGKGGVIQ